MAHDELTAWLDGRLDDLGISRTGAVDVVRERPWGRVFSVPTDAGLLWLKAPGPGTRYEVGLYPVLLRYVPDYVLHPLAVDTERGLLLLPDGGAHLEADADLAAPVRSYAVMQRALADHVDDVLAVGVPDMRPGVMPQRFDEAVAYCGERVDPRVPALRPQLVDWCDELAAAPGRASLDHNDLHAHNILPGPVFFDWGDSCVAHPFASLLRPGEVAGPAGSGRIRDAYLACFADLAPQAELIRVAELAGRVALVARALAWQRALCGYNGPEFAGAAAAHLALLIPS